MRGAQAVVPMLTNLAAIVGGFAGLMLGALLSASANADDDARVQRAVQGLWTAKRFMLRAIMATKLDRGAVRAECNRGLERIEEALREIGGDSPC